MNVEYVAQPDHQLGRILSQLLDSQPKRAVFVSAFVGLQTVMRIKDQVVGLRESGSDVRFVIGIDLGGTSHEVLKALLDCGIDVRIVKHRIPGHTFHPKLYVFEWDDKAEIIIGSNNITEGGFFRNYEGSARITYKLPGEFLEFDAACAQLRRFITPDGPTVYTLTDDFLAELIKRGEVPTEAEARQGRDVNRKPWSKTTEARDGRNLFGVEHIELPPPLPAELLERLVREVRRRRRGSVSVALPIDDKPSDSLLPAAFYMTLPTLQGHNIPGESRIPLEAIELAKEFWGWPDEYIQDVSPRAGQDRVYWNWRPKWQVWSVEMPDSVTIQEVRMYMYENSSDFRFYARPIVNAGGDLGDLVRIRRIGHPDAEYECILARQGTPEFGEWINFCTQAVRNSPRRFGYA